MTKIGTKAKFHYSRTSHPMLGQVSQVDSNIQNNTSIKSQETVPQATTVPQVTRHQTLLSMFSFFDTIPCLGMVSKTTQCECI